jgi:8-oxo-dGTP diphosphatase
LRSRHPQTGDEEVLLLKGAPTKRLWANHYNGLGGHVEAHEDIYAAAVCEVGEEAGLDLSGELPRLALRGVINIDTGSDELGPTPGILMFVFAGEAPARAVVPSEEGDLAWLPLSALREYPLVDDLYEVIPLALGDAFFHGHYSPGEDGEMVYHFRVGDCAA